MQEAAPAKMTDVPVSPSEAVKVVNGGPHAVVQMHPSGGVEGTRQATDLLFCFQHPRQL